jgi:hypothetical protein
MALNTTDEIAISVWEQLPNSIIRKIGRLVKNESDIEMAIADEVHKSECRIRIRRARIEKE